MTEEEKKILKTADVLKKVIKTEGWKYICQYITVRTISLKNELAKIDLGKNFQIKFSKNQLIGQKELEEINIADNTLKASKKQGEIKGLNNILRRVNNVLMQAEIIRKKGKEK